jgi:hypothetical protein
MFQVTNVPVLSDVFVIFLSSIVVLTPNGQLLSCITIASSERYDLTNSINAKQPVLKNSALYKSAIKKNNTYVIQQTYNSYADMLHFQI